MKCTLLYLYIIISCIYSTFVNVVCGVTLKYSPECGENIFFVLCKTDDFILGKVYKYAKGNKEQRKEQDVTLNIKVTIVLLRLLFSFDRTDLPGA